MRIDFFHLRDGADVVLDAEGRDLPSLAAVTGAALLEARAIISADAVRGQISLGQSIDVKDEFGQLVHRIAFADAVQINNSQ